MNTRAMIAYAGRSLARPRYHANDHSRDVLDIDLIGDRSRAHCVPHVAFDHAACPAHAPPRVSLEMRALALWFA